MHTLMLAIHSLLYDQRLELMWQIIDWLFTIVIVGGATLKHFQVPIG